MRVLHMLHSLDVEVGDIGTTVRRGAKWANAEGELTLCVCSGRCLDPARCDDVTQEACAVCDRQGVGAVVDSRCFAMRDVPASLIEHEHEERSRRYSGLLDSMRKAYGDGFSEDEAVTVLVYRRTA